MERPLSPVTCETGRPGRGCLRELTVACMVVFKIPLDIYLVKRYFQGMKMVVKRCPHCKYEWALRGAPGPRRCPGCGKAVA